jgi:hypothetical protein
MSTTRRALRVELTRLGEHPVEGPSVAFRNRLEHELLATTTDPPASVALVPLPRRSRRLLPLVSVAAATIAVVVLAGALLGAFGTGGRGSLQLGNAHDTTVRLPDGRTVPGRTGLGLPNGSVLRTGPNGSAAAGSVDLGPGLQGVVDNNRLVLAPAPNLPAVTLPTVPPVITLPRLPAPNLPAVPSPTLPPLGLGH